MITAEYIKAALEHAPKEGSPAPANLRGHWLKGDAGLFYVCSRCAGRMVARGCSLGRDATPVWKDQPEPFGLCVGCQGGTLEAGRLGPCNCNLTNDYQDCCQGRVEAECPACGMLASFENEATAKAPERLCEDCAKFLGS